MPTSFLATWDTPLRDTPVTRRRDACFGEFNRYTGDGNNHLEVMEWHPESNSDYVSRPNRIHTARECLEFINSFGFWKDVFHLTSMGGLATGIRSLPADQVITGFMSARNQNFDQYGFLRTNRSKPENISDLEAIRIAYVSYAAGACVGVMGINWSDPQNGESGTCRLLSTDDAYGLYLLAHGTAEECSGAFIQNPLFEAGTQNRRGYLRDSHRHEMQDFMRTSTNPRFSQDQISTWSSMSDWLRVFLRSQKVADSGKLGRLTVAQFVERHERRGGDIPSLFNMFDELKDLYS